MASAALLLYGGLQVLDGRLSLGDLMMFLVYLAMLLEPLAVLATSVTQLQNNLSGLRPRARPPGRAARDGRPPRAPSPSARARSPGGSRFEGVELRLSRAPTRTVLRDIDLDVEPGEIDRPGRPQRRGQDDALQPRRPVLRPDRRASIRLDGVDLRDIQVESYRRLLGIVEQDVFLFDGTIAENIAYADREATPARDRAGRARSPTPPSSSRPCPTATTP